MKAYVDIELTISGHKLSEADIRDASYPARDDARDGESAFMALALFNMRMRPEAEAISETDAAALLATPVVAGDPYSKNRSADAVLQEMWARSLDKANADLFETREACEAEAELLVGEMESLTSLESASPEFEFTKEFLDGAPRPGDHVDALAGILPNMKAEYPFGAADLEAAMRDRMGPSESDRKTAAALACFGISRLEGESDAELDARCYRAVHPLPPR